MDIWSWRLPVVKQIEGCFIPLRAAAVHTGNLFAEAGTTSGDIFL